MITFIDSYVATVNLCNIVYVFRVISMMQTGGLNLTYVTKVLIHVSCGLFVMIFMLQLVNLRLKLCL